MPRRPGDSAPRRRCAGRPRVPVARSRLSRSVCFLTTSINRSDHNDGHNMTKTRRTAWTSDDHHDNAPIMLSLLSLQSLPVHLLPLLTCHSVGIAAGACHQHRARDRRCDGDPLKSQREGGHL